MAIGIAAYILGNKVPLVYKIARFVGAFFESCSPFFTIILIFYSGAILISEPLVGREASVIIGLTICLLGYMPARYEAKNSLAKNLAVNIVGLVSTAFKWSSVACIVGVVELFRVAQIYIANAYGLTWELVIAVVITGGILLALELTKSILNNKLS
jgi:hypothetical protein